MAIAETAKSLQPTCPTDYLSAIPALALGILAEIGRVSVRTILHSVLFPMMPPVCNRMKGF